MRAKEFIGIAEFIKSRELSAKSKIEDLKGSLSKLSETKSSLERKVSSLYAELAAARNDVDEDGEPNYDWLAMIENQIDQANEELSDTEEEIQQDSAELEKSVGEYERIEEEKQQTLFEIQQKARSASQQMNAIGGMYVVYADIGASVNQALQESYDAFAQAAVILDGTVDSSSTGAGGRNSSGNLISNRGLSSGCVTAIAGASAILTSTPSSHAFKSAQISGTHTSRGTFHAFGERCEASKKGSRFSSSQRSSMENNAVVYRSANQDRNLSSGQESGTENMDRRSSLVSSGKTKRKSGGAQLFTEQTVHRVNDSVLSAKKGYGGKEKVFRRGRNEFIDSLIVQDWELGRYTDSSISAIRNSAAKNDYYNFVSNPEKYEHFAYDQKQVVYIDPTTIYGIRGIDDLNFWSYKNTSYSDYIDMARQIPKVYNLAKSGHKLVDLAKREDVIGACARNYFLNDDITVTRVGKGFIFGDEGRHRAMAALIAGVNIPVRVTDEYKKKNKGVSVSQKQMQSSNGSKQAANFRRDFAELSITISEQIAHANKQELIKLVRNEQIAEKADFGRMDVNVAREMVDTIRKVKCKFPFVSLPFIGASQSMNKNLEQNIRINLMRLYVQNNPTGDINVITEMVNDATEAYMKKFAIKENDLAVAITVKRPEKITKPKPGMEIAGGITEYVGDTFASKLSGIGLNEVSAVDYAALCRKLEAEEQKGASPKGCTTVKYLIYHEIAHVLDDKLKISEDPDVIREYLIHKQMSESEQADNVCTYAGKNIYEFIAEAWAESQSSPVPGKVAQLINEKINVAANAYMKAKKGDEDYVRELER